ncbi:putative F-box/LRR-repeat protein At3g18150 isoform X3 [Durio zibethinus]|uniref:F-box/LRR-repeat protein At3g18150 isoform X3 n=1 Tax=Durio zibethinus TaxID=66656 RepID=A0A6P5Y5U9_DURZI|nr:putative F-box/LRR-repeat protein At3g18150 isoform X3 [Durio zibethinus]
MSLKAFLPTDYTYQVPLFPAYTSFCFTVMQPTGETRHFVNKRRMWMKRKKQLSLSNTPSHIHLDHLHQATPSTPLLDRISELPKDVLCHILSLLPMQMAIQTSILSTRWRHLWKSTHVVDFHDLPFSARKPVDYTPITRCLDSLESPNIKSFTVVGHIGHRSHPDVRRWVEFAFSKNVETLRIGLMQISFPVKFSLLPRSFFTKNDQTQKIKVLLLSHVDFIPPRGVTFSGSGFVSLQSLSLTNCKLVDGTVESLLRKCLVLEVLVLDSCFGLIRVNISGPNLKLKQLTFMRNLFDEEEDMLFEVDAPGLATLKYSGDLTMIRLKNCEGLGEIILLGELEEVHQEIINHISELINQVTHVKILGVNLQFLQFRQQYYWAAFCETVWESILKPTFVMGEGAQYQLNQGRYLKKLKSVRVLCFSGFDGEMMLVQLLLGKAVNLQKLELLWQNHPSDMTDNVLQIVIRQTLPKRYPNPDLVATHLKKTWIEDWVTRLPRASPNAQVLFKSRWKF